MSLRLKLTVALVAAILILIVGATSFYASRESSAAAQLVDHTDRVRTQLQQTMRTMVDAETGQRGFLIVGDSVYLEPFLRARTEVTREVATLRALTVDNPVQQQRVDSLALTADRRLVILDETVLLATAGKRDSAIRLVRTGGGLAATTRFRELIAEMDSTESDLLAERTQLYEHRKLIETLVVVIGSILAAVLSLLTLTSIRVSVIELERAKDTIEEQSEELATQLEESQSLTEELAASNDELVHANVATDAARVLFEQLLQSTDEGLFGIDERGLCTFVNVAGARMLGYEREEIVGQNIHALAHSRHVDGSPFPESECPIYRCFHTGTSMRASDEVFWKKDGAPLPVEYTASPIFEHGRSVGGVVAYNDISLRRVAERERERLITALGRSNQELDQFAYVASHDLKAPLRGIANLSQWIEEDLGDTMTPDAGDKMRLLRGRVHRLEALIDGILQYSRAGRTRAHVERVDVGALVHEVIELLAPPATVTITVAPDMPTVASERTPLQQVFMNLIGNAIKYNRAPGATIAVTVRDTGAFYAFSVADNGPGIPAEYHDRIFGIFQTLESRDKVEGTGIGLSVVKKTVELRGGSVVVESTPEHGATFTFEWPKMAREQSAA